LCKLPSQQGNIRDWFRLWRLLFLCNYSFCDGVVTPSQPEAVSFLYVGSPAFSWSVSSVCSLLAVKRTPSYHLWTFKLYQTISIYSSARAPRESVTIETVHPFISLIPSEDRHISLVFVWKLIRTLLGNVGNVLNLTETSLGGPLFIILYLFKHNLKLALEPTENFHLHIHYGFDRLAIIFRWNIYFICTMYK